MEKWTCTSCTVRNYVWVNVCTECGFPSGRPVIPPPSSSAAPSVVSNGAKRSRVEEDVDVVELDDDDDEEEKEKPLPRASASSAGGRAAAAARSSSLLSPIDSFEDSAPSARDNSQWDNDDDNDVRASQPAKKAGAGVKYRKRAPVAEARVGVRAEKAANKLAEKEKKASDRNVDRADRGGFAQLEIVAALSPDFVASPIGEAVRAALAEGEHAMALGVLSASRVVERGPPDKLAVLLPPILNSVHWRRRRVDSSSRGGVVSFLPGFAVEPFVVQVYADQQFLRLLAEEGTDGVAARLRSQRASVGEGTRIIYVIQGARQAAASFRGGSGQKLLVTPDALDYAYMHLWVNNELEVKETLNASQTGEYIASLTRAIAEYPYRMDPSALACVTKIAVAKAKAPASGAAAAAAAGDFDDEDGGGGPPKRKMTKKTSSDTWVAQLQMIPRVSAKIAGAIAARYPTFRSLCDEYASPRLTTVQKMSLLEDILHGTGSGKSQPKLSRDICRFFSTMNGDEIIGAEK